MICPVPLAGPYVAVARNPSVLPEALVRSACPPATMLSGWPAGASGQVNCLTALPATMPTDASACADKLDPAPSKSPAAVSLSSVTATLLNRAGGESAGTSTADVVVTPSLWPLSAVNAARCTSCADGIASAGTVTVQVVDSEFPGARSARLTGEAGET